MFSCTRTARHVEYRERIRSQRAAPLNPFGDDYIGTDFATTKWLRENTKIPVAEDMKHWKDASNHFFLMKKVPGQSLEEIWPLLRQNEKELYAREVIEYIAELRKNTAASPQTVEGGLLRDNLLGTTHDSVMMVEDQETWWARLAPVFVKASPERLEDTKSIFPKQTTQYVLTHCDLNAGNIMVHNGHVSGIIDWEQAGYFPNWWEHASLACWTSNPYWARYLFAEMEKQLTTEFGNHRDAVEFCEVFRQDYKKPRRQLHQPIEIRGNFCDCKPVF